MSADWCASCEVTDVVTDSHDNDVHLCNNNGWCSWCYTAVIMLGHSETSSSMNQVSFIVLLCLLCTDVKTVCCCNKQQQQQQQCIGDDMKSPTCRSQNCIRKTRNMFCGMWVSVPLPKFCKKLLPHTKFHWSRTFSWDKQTDIQTDGQHRRIKLPSQSWVATSEEEEDENEEQQQQQL